MGFHICCSVAGAGLLALGGLLTFSCVADAQNRRTTAVAQSPGDDAAFKAAFEETLRKPNDPTVLMR